MPNYKDTNNKLHVLDSAEFEHLLPVGCVPITEEEAEALRPKPPVQTYAELRAAAYPSVADQLDALWKGGADAEAMRAEIIGIKTRFPAPAKEIK